MIVAVLLLVPVGLVVGKRWALLRATGGIDAWSDFRRFLHGVIFWSWLGWFLMLPWVPPPDSNLAARWIVGAVFDAGWCLLPPVFVMLVCDALEVDAFACLRRLDSRRGALALRLAYRNLLPLLFVVAAIVEAADGEPRAGPMWYASALLAYVLLARLSRMLDLVFTTGRELGAGAVRDRIFELARQEQVRVNRVSVVAAGREQLANAAALLGNDVLLTDYLLAHLSPREVDVMVAHELAHLKWRPLLVRTLAVVGAGVAGVYAVTALGRLTPWPPSLPLYVAVALLIVYLILRRFEYAADAEAARLTGDPEALTSAILKVARLNLTALDWSWWEELIHSRPSAARRVAKLEEIWHAAQRQVKEP
jgi:Zn-dependent protease with chaperone function